MPRNTSVEDFLSLVESGDIPPPEVSKAVSSSACVQPKFSRECVYTYNAALASLSPPLDSVCTAVMFSLLYMDDELP